MSMSLRDRRAYRADEKQQHALLDEEEKRRLLGVGSRLIVG